MDKKQASYVTTRDSGQFKSPVGWDFSISSFNPRAFEFSEIRFPIGSGIEIGLMKFRGNIRYRAHMIKKGVQLNFIDAYVSPGNPSNRLQGMARIDKVVMLTKEGYDWDALQNHAAIGLEININESKLLETIESDWLHNRLLNLSRVFGTNRSIVSNPLFAGSQLREMALSLVRRHMQLYAAANNHTEPIELHSKMGLAADFHSCSLNRFVALIESTIDEIVFAGKPAIEKIGSDSRRRAALQIEEAIMSGQYIDLSSISEKLGISRRTAQLAVKEQFGCGFYQLQHINKMHKARELIRRYPRKTVTELAHELNMSHLGRFSYEYKSFFGVLPSRDRVAIL